MMKHLAAALGKRSSSSTCDGTSTPPPPAKAAKIDPPEPTLGDLKKKMARIGRDTNNASAYLREVGAETRRDIAALADDLGEIRQGVRDLQKYDAEKQAQLDATQVHDDLQCQMEDVLDAVKQLQDSVEERADATVEIATVTQQLLKDQLELRRDVCSLKEAVLNLGLAWQQQHPWQPVKDAELAKPPAAAVAAPVCTCSPSNSV